MLTGVFLQHGVLLVWLHRGLQVKFTTGPDTIPMRFGQLLHLVFYLR